MTSGKENAFPPETGRGKKKVEMNPKGKTGPEIAQV